MSKSCSHVPTLLIAITALFAAHSIGAAKDETVTNTLGMKLVLIPAGEFVMGAEEDRSETLKYFAPYCDPKWLDGELPRHPVRITKPFYMGKCEVTLGEFLMFYHQAQYKTEIERDGKPARGTNRPRNQSSRTVSAPGRRAGRSRWTIPPSSSRGTMPRSSVNG